MSDGLARLKSGDFNTMVQVRNPDGSRTITLRKRGEDKQYRFTVQDLNGPEETVLQDEVIDRTAARLKPDKAALLRGII